MKLFAVIAVFLLGNGTADDTPRQRFRPTEREVLVYLDQMNAVDDFRLSVADHCKSVAIRPGTAARSLRQVSESLDNLATLSIAYAYNYVRNKLIFYCDVAIGLLEKKSRAAGFVESFREKFKFEYDPRDYCAVTFLHHSGSECPVDEIFSSIRILQTFPNAPRTDDRQTLADEIRQLKNRLDVSVNFQNCSLVKVDVGRKINTGMLAALKKQSESELLELLATIKGDIKSLSRKLCSPAAVPFVGEDFFSVTKVAAYKDHFIRYSMRMEKCNVDDSPEYGIRNYKNELKTSPEYGVEDYIQIKWKLKERDNSRQRSDLIIGLIRQGADRTEYERMTLSVLKKRIQLNNVVADVLLYNKIQATAIVFVALKEGFKIFKGIYYILRKCCYEFHRTSHIQLMRNKDVWFFGLQLWVLRSVYEKLLDGILENRLVNVDDYSLSEFKERMEKISTHFSLIASLNAEGRKISNKRQREQLMEGICDQLDTNYYNINLDGYVEGEDIKLAFYKYHFIGPMLNMSKLYDLVKTRRIESDTP